MRRLQPLSGHRRAARREGYTAVQIGDMLGVNEKTVRRTNGWKEYLTYGLTDKTDKTDTKTQNPEKDAAVHNLFIKFKICS